MVASSTLLRATIGSLPAAGLIWVAAFRWHRFNFWLKMSLATGGLGAFTIVVRGNVLAQEGLHLSDLFVGTGAAGLLYVGLQLVDRIGRVLLPRLADQLAELPQLRSLAPRALIAVLLVFVIAPGEELYWRGLVQTGFVQAIGPATGIVVAACAYGMAHLLAGRLVLAAAATASGLFWGLLYAWVGRLWPIVISHVLWDLLVFLLRPPGGPPSEA